MSLLSRISSSIFTDVWSSLTTLIISYSLYLLAKFYYQVYTLPPGPIPIPLFGNILKFRGTRDYWTRELEKIAEKYGKVFTFWLGNKPIVIINDIDIARDAMKSTELTGRPKDLFFPEAGDMRTGDITFNSGREWEALRRVSHSAVLKYSVTDKLANLVTDITDVTMDQMLKNEGINKSFHVFDYVYNTFNNIISASAFCKRYDMNDQEYKLMKYIGKDFFVENGQRISWWMASKLARKLDRNKINELRKNFHDAVVLLENKFVSHYKDYDESVIRDFCDALITAKNEAIKANKESAPYLKDYNLANAILDMFFAGTATSEMTFNWCLLHMLYNKDIEKKLRSEVETLIGDRIPTHEDRTRCHYVMAFISECLRHSNVVPTGVNHETLADTTIGDYKIAKGTEVIVHHGHIMHQSEHWEKPHDFIPERFLDSNGQYVTVRPKAYIPFGVGRRVCIGEKMAIADLFLVLVRFLQKTSDFEIVLHCDPKEDMLFPDPNNFFEFHPKYFEISFKNII